MNPYLELVIASFIFGSSGVFTKILHLPPTTLTFFRVAVPTLIFFLYLKRKGVKLFQGNDKLILTASLLNAIRLLLFFAAFTFATIGKATLSTAVFPAFVFVYSSLILGEQITKRKAILLFMTLLGIVALYSNQPLSFSNKDFIGISFGILESAINSLATVIFKKELSRYSTSETIFYQNFIGVFLFLPFLFLNPPPQLWQLSLVTLSSFLIGVCSFIFYFSALRKVTAAGASIATFDSVVAVAFGIVIFKEVLTVNMFLGGVLILLSSLLIRKEL